MADPEVELQHALAAILAEARAQVGAGRDLNASGLEARIAVAARRARSAGSDPTTAQADALAQLRRIAAVHRARALVKREVTQPARASLRRPVTLRTSPTITGSLDVRRVESDGFRLAWDAVAAVGEWEVRFSERAGVRGDYVERESFTLAAGETSIDLPLGDNPFRVNILGRGRGRLQRRALISGLTREGWRDRWQRRASAS